MGIGIFRTCKTNSKQPAPNPDPSRWKLLHGSRFPNATILMVQYLDCTNYEGKKILVFDTNTFFRNRTLEGIQKEPLDPHFNEKDSSLIARFNPSMWEIAYEFAKNYKT
jgi:hypothetical protein